MFVLPIRYFWDRDLPSPLMGIFVINVSCLSLLFSFYTCSLQTCDQLLGCLIVMFLVFCTFPCFKCGTWFADS